MATLKTLVLTLIGADRAGLVELVAGTVTAHRGNWLGSQMARMSGKFAGILEVEIPDDEAAEFEASLGHLTRHGLRVVVEAAEQSAVMPHPVLRLELVGQDRPGIVREISRTLADLGVNVEELKTWRSPAPMSGETLFSATAQLGIPPGLSQEALQQRLERIAGDLMVDLHVEEAQQGQ